MVAFYITLQTTATKEPIIFYPTTVFNQIIIDLTITKIMTLMLPTDLATLPTVTMTSNRGLRPHSMTFALRILQMMVTAPISIHCMMGPIIMLLPLKSQRIKCILLIILFLRFLKLRIFTVKFRIMLLVIIWCMIITLTCILIGSRDNNLHLM